jgi:hypothetical protein
VISTTRALATPYISAQRVIVPELVGEETEPVALLGAAPLFGAWGARAVVALAVAGQTLAVLLISAGALREATTISRRDSRS